MEVSVPYTIRIKSIDTNTGFLRRQNGDLHTTAKYYFKSFGFNVTDDESIKNVVYVQKDAFDIPEKGERGIYIFIAGPSQNRINGTFDYYMDSYKSDNENPPFTKINVNSLIELPLKLNEIYAIAVDKFSDTNKRRKLVGPNNMQLHF